MHNFQSSTALARYSNQRKLWDSPLFESDSFVALPTVGAFIEGWLLIVPRTHVLNYSRLPDHLWPELLQFATDVAGHVEAQYGPVALFEHGPGHAESPIGCGVDYAHFHIVPTRKDLHACARSVAPNVAWEPHFSITGIKHFRDSEFGYWAILQKEYSDRYWIGTISGGNPPNQLFRRVLAHSEALRDAEFDWREQLGEKNILATIEKLSCAVSAHE